MWLELTPESAAMVARFSIAGFYRFPPLELRRLRKAIRSAFA
jgi:hypothetical protein